MASKSLLKCIQKDLSLSIWYQILKQPKPSKFIAHRVIALAGAILHSYAPPCVIDEMRSMEQSSRERKHNV